MRLLVVENDDGVRDSLCDLLRALGVDATGLADPLQAGQVLRSHRWDMVLTDMLFPGAVTGLSVAAQAARLGVRCVIMSGAMESDPEIAVRGLPFLAKPFGTADLLAMIGQEDLHLPLA